MIYLLFVIILISHSAFSMLKDEVRALVAKPSITEITTPASQFIPKLTHAVQNNIAITLLITGSTEYTRTQDLKAKTKTHSARFLKDNVAWDALAAEKSFYELIAIHKLVDRTAAQIMASCNRPSKASK